MQYSCGKCDDTALNGIEMSCKRKNSDTYEGTISSFIGPWGVWTDYKHCITVGRVDFFLTRYRKVIHNSRFISKIMMLIFYNLGYNLKNNNTKARLITNAWTSIKTSMS